MLIENSRFHKLAVAAQKAGYSHLLLNKYAVSGIYKDSKNPPKDTRMMWPAIWEIVQTVGFQMSCGSGHQAQINGATMDIELAYYARLAVTVKPLVNTVKKLYNTDYHPGLSSDCLYLDLNQLRLIPEKTIKVLYGNI